ncbi:hypothetical protein [Burkholderia pseudomallei]|uniref:hypothetical protein n=1 Tax=Burkholderia pseudomallei TaxID=28450 RepID=UPI00193D6FA5|nr:hypothetical protein [Burkholderia pseudomallei]QRM25816.1 hypothetical protein JQX71_32325 [Burkholderia pseudomallei]
MRRRCRISGRELLLSAQEAGGLDAAAYGRARPFSAAPATRWLARHLAVSTGSTLVAPTEDHRLAGIDLISRRQRRRRLFDARRGREFSVI